MTPKHHRLGRELILLVVAKLILLTAIWWVFIRDARVAVDVSSAARHFTSASQGETHAQ